MRRNTAVARFRVSHVDNPTKDISVYLDWYDRLGCMGEPYWEAYRGSGTDPERFLLTEADKLAETIDAWLKPVREAAAPDVRLPCCGFKMGWCRCNP